MERTCKPAWELVLNRIYTSGNFVVVVWRKMREKTTFDKPVEKCVGKVEKKWKLRMDKKDVKN